MKRIDKVVEDIVNANDISDPRFKAALKDAYRFACRDCLAAIEDVGPIKGQEYIRMEGEYEA